MVHRNIRRQLPRWLRRSDPHRVAAVTVGLNPAVVSSLSIDFETRSAVDLKTAGVYRYAQDPTTDVWCIAWAFDDEEPEIWTPDGVKESALPANLPTPVLYHIEQGGELRAWNAQFERIIWREIMVKRYGAPEVKLEQWVCSAAEAAAMALPRYLAGAAHALGVPQQKDEVGSRLMLRMARPRKTNPDGTHVWWDVQEKKDVLFAYCKQDVRTERSIVKTLRRLTPMEREIYLLDQRTNDRGVPVDLDLVAAAKGIVDIGVTRANSRLDDLTNGAVSKVSNNGRLLEFLNDAGVEGDSVSKASIAALLERDDLSPNIVEILTLRAQAGRSSVAKLSTLASAASFDGRARGLLLYHGASTGRWTGRLIQPQNFPRGEVEHVEDFIPLVMAGEYDTLDLVAPPIVIVLSMLRSMLTASPGHELIAADYSAIEARVLNWLAGQEDMVELFRQYDAAPKKDKPRYDPYRHNAARLYGIPLDRVEKFPHRQTGKFQELGCGYGMGKDKAVSAAKTVYQLDISKAQAKEIVDSYRATHAKVVGFWYETENACINAVLRAGEVQTFGGQKNLRAVVRGAYLYIILPSGRPLCYAAPHIADRLTPWGEMKASLHFKGVDSYSKQWGTLSAYGGLLVENIVQAASRDLMAESMLRHERAGYAPILSVHDEEVCEVPAGFGSVEEFERIMSDLPAWATGCPVAAEGWRGFRYRK